MESTHKAILKQAAAQQPDCIVELVLRKAVTEKTKAQRGYFYGEICAHYLKWLQEQGVTTLEYCNAITGKPENHFVNLDLVAFDLKLSVGITRVKPDGSIERPSISGMTIAEMSLLIQGSIEYLRNEPYCIEVPPPTTLQK